MIVFTISTVSLFSYPLQLLLIHIVIMITIITLLGAGPAIPRVADGQSWGDPTQLFRKADSPKQKRRSRKGMSLSHGNGDGLLGLGVGGGDEDEDGEGDGDGEDEDGQSSNTGANDGHDNASSSSHDVRDTQGGSTRTTSTTSPSPVRVDAVLNRLLAPPAGINPTFPQRVSVTQAVTAPPLSSIKVIVADSSSSSSGTVKSANASNTTATGVSTTTTTAPSMSSSLPSNVTNPRPLVIERLQRPPLPSELANKATLEAATHVLKRHELMNVDVIKSKLAQNKIAIPRGVLERSLVTPVVLLSSQERTDLPQPMSLVAPNPFQVVVKPKKKTTKKKRKEG